MAAKSAGGFPNFCVYASVNPLAGSAVGNVPSAAGPSVLTSAGFAAESVRKSFVFVPVHCLFYFSSLRWERYSDKVVRAGLQGIGDLPADCGGSRTELGDGGGTSIPYSVAKNPVQS